MTVEQTEQSLAYRAFVDDCLKVARENHLRRRLEKPGNSYKKYRAHGPDADAKSEVWASLNSDQRQLVLELLDDAYSMSAAYLLSNFDWRAIRGELKILWNGYDVASPEMNIDKLGNAFNARMEDYGWAELEDM